VALQAGVEGAYDTQVAHSWPSQPHLLVNTRLTAVETVTQAVPVSCSATPGAAHTQKDWAAGACIDQLSSFPVTHATPIMLAMGREGCRRT
jgi:hypothetical protein